MSTENLASAVRATSELQPFSEDQLQLMLKESPLRHPALNRVQAKLVASAETESVISSYDRMHHRHSRS
jgi:hypothetical protein